MHVLHLLKGPPSPAALEVIARQATDPELRVSVVLLHGAVAPPCPPAARVYRLDPGPAAPPADSAITHAGLLDLIFAADSVVAW